MFCTGRSLEHCHRGPRGCVAKARALVRTATGVDSAKPSCRAKLTLLLTRSSIPVGSRTAPERLTPTLLSRHSERQGPSRGISPQKTQGPHSLSQSTKPRTPRMDQKDPPNVGAFAANRREYEPRRSHQPARTPRQTSENTRLAPTVPKVQPARIPASPSISPDRPLRNKFPETITLLPTRIESIQADRNIGRRPR